MVPRIHCITDFPIYDDAALGVLEAVAQAGVDAVQVRAKSLDDRALLCFTRAVLDCLAGLPTRVVVNDRLDVALAAGAHGVHVGREDLPVHEVRRLVPDGFLVGATCRSYQHAREARVQGADYAGVGPVYRTATKQGLPEPIGLQGLREAAGVLPAVAVGGIGPDQVPAVMATGAHGVAAASALCRAPDPARGAEKLVEAVLAA